MKEVKKNKLKLRKGFVAAMLAVIIMVFVILLSTVLLPIKSLEIEYSGKKYSPKEILAVANIEKGDNIIMTLEGVVNKKVTEGLPYIGSVELKKELPDKITLMVKETKSVYCIYHKKKYVTLDSSFKVLEIVDKRDKKLTYIKGLKMSSVDLGKTAEFKDATALKSTKDIIKTVKKSGNSINQLDVTSKFDVKLSVNGKYSVEIGTTTELTEKLVFMNKMIEQIEKKHKNDKGTINLRYYSEKKEGYFTRGDDKEYTYAK